MAGLGQADNHPLQVPQMPLVSPAQPVGQDAVNSMIDAFRKGTITSQDIIDRTGVVAQEKKKAEMITAALTGETAQSMRPLVPLQAEAQKVKLGTEIASGIQGPTGLQAFQQMGPWSGRSMDEFRDPKTGQYDFSAAAAEGNKMAAQMNVANGWIERLTPVADREVKDPETGITYFQKVNKWGVDVTPPSGEFEGSDEYWNYIGQLRPVLPKFHPARALYMMENPEGAMDATKRNGSVAPGLKASENASLRMPTVLPAMTPKGEGITIPEAPQVSAARAQLVSSGMDTGAALALTPEQAVSALAKQSPPVVLPNGATVMTKPEDQPVKRKPLGIFKSANPGNVWDEQKTREFLEKAEPYKDWQLTVKNIGAFENNAKQIMTLTPAQQRATNLNVADIGLAESLIKMYDPAGVIREFKWDKFEKNQPLLSKLKNVQAAALGQGSFTPETRQELIKMGYDIIKTREEAARPHLELAARRIEGSGKLGNVLTSDDLRVLGKDYTTQPTSAAGAGAAPAGVPAGATLTTITGRGQGYVVGNQFYPVSK